MRLDMFKNNWVEMICMHLNELEVRLKAIPTGWVEWIYNLSVQVP